MKFLANLVPTANVSLSESGELAEAQFNLGRCLDKLGDPNDAAIWYEQAIQRDHVKAGYFLARLYFESRTTIVADASAIAKSCTATLVLPDAPMNANTVDTLNAVANPNTSAITHRNAVSKAIALLENCAKRSASDAKFCARVKLLQAKIHLASGNPDQQAITSLVGASRSVEAHLALAYLYFRDTGLDDTKKLEQIQACFSTAAKSLDSSPDVAMARVFEKQSPSSYFDSMPLLTCYIPGIALFGLGAQRSDSKSLHDDGRFVHLPPQKSDPRLADGIDLFVPNGPVDVTYALNLACAHHPCVLGPLATSTNVEIPSCDNNRERFPFAYIRPHCSSSSVVGLVQRNGFAEKHLVSILRDAAIGLAHLHSHNLVHGNVSPYNIVQLEDVKSKDPTGKDEVLGAIRVGTSSRVAIAPESIEQGMFTPASDVFHFAVSLSVLLLRPLQADVLFIPQSQLQLQPLACRPSMVSHGASYEPRLTIDVQSLRKELPLSLPEWCPRLLSVIILKCLQENPSDRPSMVRLSESLISVVASAYGGDMSKIAASLYQQGSQLRASQAQQQAAHLPGQSLAQGSIGRGTVSSGSALDVSLAQAKGLAFRKLHQAAVLLHTGGQVETGVMLKMGEGVALHMREAARFLDKAANPLPAPSMEPGKPAATVTGDPNAQYELGELLEDPRNVDRDEMKGALLYHKAACIGNSGAQFRLARLLADDRIPQGTFPSPVELLAKAAFAAGRSKIKIVNASILLASVCDRTGQRNLARQALERAASLDSTYAKLRLALWWYNAEPQPQPKKDADPAVNTRTWLTRTAEASTVLVTGIGATTGGADGGSAGPVSGGADPSIAIAQAVFSLCPVREHVSAASSPLRFVHPGSDFEGPFTLIHSSDYCGNIEGRVLGCFVAGTGAQKRTTPISLVIPSGEINIGRLLARCSPPHHNVLGPVAIAVNVELLDEKGFRENLPLALVLNDYRNGNRVSELQVGIRAERSRALQPILALAADIAAGLSHLHAHGVIHGNPSLHNMLATTTGKGDIATGLGYPRRTAIESLRDNHFSTYSDVFHFAMSIIELFTGGSWETGWPEPIKSTDTTQSTANSSGSSSSAKVALAIPDEKERFRLLQACVRSGYAEVRQQLVSWCPRVLSDLLLACLVVDPLRRPIMSHVAVQLRALSSSSPTDPMVQPPPPQQSQQPKQSSTHSVSGGTGSASTSATAAATMGATAPATSSTNNANANSQVHKQFWMHTAHICMDFTVDDSLLRPGGVFECLYGTKSRNELKANYNPTSSRCKTLAVCKCVCVCLTSAVRSFAPIAYSPSLR